MASVNLKKEQIRTGRIIGTNHMDRTKENDTRSHSNKNINPELSSGNFHVGCESFKEAMDNAEKRLKEVIRYYHRNVLKRTELKSYWSTSHVLERLQNRVRPRSFLIRSTTV